MVTESSAPPVRAAPQAEQNHHPQISTRSLGIKHLQKRGKHRLDNQFFQVGFFKIVWSHQRIGQNQVLVFCIFFGQDTGIQDLCTFPMGKKIHRPDIKPIKIRRNDSSWVVFSSGVTNQSNLNFARKTEPTGSCPFQKYLVIHINFLFWKHRRVLSGSMGERIRHQEKCLRGKMMWIAHFVEDWWIKKSLGKKIAQSVNASRQYL